MIIIGEKINATRKAIAAALGERNEKVIIQTAVEQAAAGADFIDVNGGDPREGMEVKNMAWLVELIQANTDKALAIDSADVAAMRMGLSLAKKKPILNSISLESDRLTPMLPIVAGHDCMVVALLMSDAGTPCGVDDRLQRAEALIVKLTAAGKDIRDIIIDPCFLPVSADMQAGRMVIDAIAKIHATWPDVHIGGGCSNISFGLPKRRLINLALLTQAIYHGMDTGLVDPCAEGVMATILAAEAVAGKDDFCMNYVMNMK
jgi:cobalamin-dependent methionine synthase I